MRDAEYPPEHGASPLAEDQWTTPLPHSGNAWTHEAHSPIGRAAHTARYAAASDFARTTTGTAGSPTTAASVPAGSPASGSAATTSRKKRWTPLGWIGRGLVLLTVSVVSGMTWLWINPRPPHPAPQPAAPQTRYQFQLVAKEDQLHDCHKVATARIAEFFAAHDCEHLTRALYTTRLPDGEQMATSVVTVKMPDAASAAQLNALTTQDGTGNIKHLSDDRATPGKLPPLKDHAYASQQQDSLVVIGDSAYFSRPTPQQDPTALDVTRDALALGWPQEKSTPQ